MRKLPSYHRCFFTLLLIVPFSLIPMHAQDTRPKNQIPPASLPCSDEERQWWETLRLSGTEAAKMLERKEIALKEKRRGARHIPDNEEELLSKNEREKLNAALVASTEKYLGSLREGKEKGYRVPIPDGRPIILQKTNARYTNAAREAKVNGTIVVSVVFQAEGIISDPKIIRGLGHGLDEKAVEAAIKIAFLPAVKGSRFTSTRGNMEFSFSIY